ncbi:Satratoxin biosynthesis SC1 cluster protein 4 [Apiospora hydei]|uniref:Satratoxin biosynthesis SC1 cluster protein 4 n=1 Tax=Apiospora hydei TaxID=1337664 RepID=A0ABR1UVW4_9PEZI
MDGLQLPPPGVDMGSAGDSAGVPSSVGGGPGQGQALAGATACRRRTRRWTRPLFAMLPHNTSTWPIIAVSIICILVATTAVTLRVYTRQFILNRVGPDDFMAVAALAGITALGAITIIHTNFGLGTHIYDIAMDPLLIMDFFKSLELNKQQFFYLGVVVYNFTLVFVKLSLFLQYYRLVDQVPRYRPLFLGAGFVVMGWTIAMVFSMTFICVPVYAYWDKSVPHVCLSDPMMQLTNSVGNIVTDLILLLLPMPVLWRLNLPIRQKWGVIGIFSLGFITCIVSLLRVIFVFDHGPSSDITFEGTVITGWTIAEVTTGLLASSLITLRPLMSKIAPAAWRSSPTGKSTGATTTNGNNNSNANNNNKDLENNTNTNSEVGVSFPADKSGLANNEPPIQMHPVLSQKQEQQQQPLESTINNNDNRPDSAPESDGGLSRTSSEIELVVQKPDTTADRRKSRGRSRTATLNSAPEGRPLTHQGRSQSQRQQDYQRHRQSRSASYFQNNSLDYDSNTIGSDQMGMGMAGSKLGRAASTSTAATPRVPLGSQRSGLQGGPAALRDNQERRPHAATQSVDRVPSLHPSHSTSSYSTTPPPPPPPKSPWALAAAMPPQQAPSQRRPERDGSLPPPLPRGSRPPTTPLPETPQAPRPPFKQHAHSNSSSSMLSDVSYEVKVWAPKGINDRR